jgi:two-component system, NtrC family, response regulator PilR
MARILVIDDSPDVLNAIVKVLEANDHDTIAADDGESGIRALERNEFDIVFTDLKMPGISGIEVLDYIIEKALRTICIILTGHGSIKSSVEAIKRGAFDYITKPISATEIMIVVNKALKFRDLEEENIRLKKKLRDKYRHTKLIGTSEAITQIYKIIQKVADTDGTILITGPSGTGKELIAGAIHYHSSRGDKPLIVINCGAIPEELLESELFGHEKGAFTGAYKSRIGRIEMANCGTVFLDEIGEMSPSLQVKLLRVLQEQKFERVGGTKTIHVDLRFIAATNKNLTVAINKGAFREDLYYRLNVIPIKVPPLKQRKTDIPLLVDHFLKKFQPGREKKINGFSSVAMEALLAYDWPGNVRELENIIKRLTILCDNDVVSFNDLPENIQETGKSIQPVQEVALEKNDNLNKAVRDYEKRLILQALEKSNWVKSKAAKLLKINRTTLVEKIKKQKLEEIATL